MAQLTPVPLTTTILTVPDTVPPLLGAVICRRPGVGVEIGVAVLADVEVAAGVLVLVGVEVGAAVLVDVAV